MRNGAAEVFYMVKVKEQLRDEYPADFSTEERLIKDNPLFKNNKQQLQRAVELAVEEKRVAEEAAGTVYNLNILFGLGTGNVIALILGYVNEWMGGESI